MGAGGASAITLTHNGNALGNGHAIGGEEADELVHAYRDFWESGVRFGGTGEGGVPPSERNDDSRPTCENHCFTARNGDDVGTGHRIRASFLQNQLHTVYDVQPPDTEIGA